MAGRIAMFGLAVLLSLVICSFPLVGTWLYLEGPAWLRGPDGEKAQALWASLTFLGVILAFCMGLCLRLAFNSTFPTGYSPWSTDKQKYKS